MPKLTQEQKEYLAKYRKEKIRRIPFDVKVDIYNRIKIMAEYKGYSLTGYIRKLVEADMDRNWNDALQYHNDKQNREAFDSANSR